VTSYKYKAFISYSHADEAYGSWLQRALEAFRLPGALVGRPTANGPIPRRLTPVFRDRNDLPAAGNLSAEIQSALRDSQFQIVICSPRAAQSRWVNEEVKFFKSVHGAERTLAVIVDGEPGAAGAGRPELECFPPALRFTVDAGGAITTEPAEPVAADARREGDGRRYAVLKLAAGLVGVGLDDLVRRDAHRRARAAWGAAAAAGGVAALMAGVSVYAVRQRDEARLMRGNAEDLIEFMLGDLRGLVEPLGRTDALEALGNKALSYYASQDERRLDAGALARRARALILVGEINQKRNDLNAALAAYEAAAAATGELLRRAPRDGRRLFDHAQSVFFVGSVAVERNDLAKGEAQMNEYLRLADQMVAINPDDPVFRLELAYATNNLGAMKFKSGDFAAAIPFFEQSADARRILHETNPDNGEMALAYAYALSWIAFAEMRRGDFVRAETVFGRQFAVYDAMIARGSEDYRVFHHYAIGRRRLAETELYQGELDAAAQHLGQARRFADRLAPRDPSNAEWAATAAHVDVAVSELKRLTGAPAEAAAAAARAADTARDVFEADKSKLDNEFIFAAALGQALDTATGRQAETFADALRELMPRLEALDIEGAPAAYGAASLAMARHEIASGAPLKARRIVATATARLSAIADRLSVEAQLALFELALEAGDSANARKAATRLAASGVRHPRYLRLADRLARVAVD
jgi:tetratricopeptide (TPR) repeat protein